MTHDPMALLDDLPDRPLGHTDPVGERLTPAEIRMRREALGLTQQHLADELGLAAKTIRRWEAADPAATPHLSLDGDLRDLEDIRDSTVADLVEEAQANPGEPIITYATDRAMPEGRFPALWHRLCADRARLRVPGLRVMFAEDTDV